MNNCEPLDLFFGFLDGLDCAIWHMNSWPFTIAFMIVIISDFLSFLSWSFHRPTGFAFYSPVPIESLRCRIFYDNFDQDSCELCN